MTPEEDKAQQQAHADKIREKRESQQGRATGESRPDPSIAQLKQELQAAKNEVAALKARLAAVESARVCGQGFSGDIKSGISFDPNAAGLGAGGGGRLVLLEDDVWFNAPDSTFYYINIWTDGRFEEI